MRTRRLWLLSCLVLVVMALGAGAAPDPALVGYWSGDEVSGIKVFDGSGQGHPGFVYGEVQQIPGRVGRGLQFDRDSYVEIGSSTGLDLGEQFTIEFLILAGEQKGNFPMFVRGDMMESFDLYFDPPGGMNLRVGKFKGIDHVARGFLDPAAWQHVAWTYDGKLGEKSLRVYVNGELKQTWDEAGQMGASRKPLTIGRGASLDEIRLYQRALSAEEVAERAQAPEKFVGREVVVSQVWPSKLLTRPGEKAVLKIGVGSLAAVAKTVKLKVFLEGGVDRVIPLQETTVALGPGEVKDLSVDWDPGANRYGYDLVAEVRDEQGQLLDRKSETFLVGKNPYQLGQYTMFASYTWDEESLKAARRHAVTMRRYYIPLSEYWCINPDNFAKCVPDSDKWFVGMGATAYRDSEETTQALLTACHELGLGVVPYSISYASGYYGTRMALEHPEWMAYDSKGRITGGVETELLELMTKFYQRYPRSLEDQELMAAIGRFPNSGAGLQISTVNLANRETMRFHAAQVAAGVKHFQWDGLRWDGHPQVGGPGDPVSLGVPELFDVTGKPLVPDPATRDRITVDNTRMVKELVLKENPNAVFGYNWGLEYEKHGRVRPTDYEECCKDGGTILWESINSIHDASSPWHRWKDAADAMADEVEHPWQYGGFLQLGYFPWWNAQEVFGRHLISLILAARARLAGAPGLDSNGPYLRFAGRYSELLYDPTVARSTEWAKAVHVDSDRVWWQKYVYERPAAEGRQVIVHLINSPATEFVEIGGTTSPPLMKNVQVSFDLPGGQRPQGVYLLSPDRRPFLSKLQPQGQGKQLVVTVPELLYWAVVVLQF